jgi:hypothetical protein
LPKKLSKKAQDGLFLIFSFLLIMVVLYFLGIFDPVVNTTKEIVQKNLKTTQNKSKKPQNKKPKEVKKQIVNKAQPKLKKQEISLEKPPQMVLKKGSLFAQKNDISNSVDPFFQDESTSKQIKKQVPQKEPQKPVIINSKIKDENVQKNKKLQSALDEQKQTIESLNQKVALLQEQLKIKKKFSKTNMSIPSSKSNDYFQKHRYSCKLKDKFLQNEPITNIIKKQKDKFLDAGEFFYAKTKVNFSATTSAKLNYIDDQRYSLYTINGNSYVLKHIIDDVYICKRAKN